MLDLLQPWVVKSLVVISALALLDVLLYMLCVRLERRQSARCTDSGRRLDPTRQLRASGQ